jgi:hypothetical protein
MRRVVMRTIISALLALNMISCSGNKTEASGDTHPADLLPNEISATDITRSSDIRTFKGDSLWAYIDGGAEVYYGYNFAEVATADYQQGKISFVADIYRFDSPLNAYGMYSISRSADSKPVALGMEGCASPGQLQFAKGNYLVRLTGFDDTEASAKALESAAESIAKSITAPDKAPREFKLLPDSNKIDRSDRYVAQSFLQLQFLTKVFTRSYLLDGDTVTLFYSTDDPGQKILQWSKLAEADKSLSHLPADIPYDESKGFIATHKVYRPIMVGMRLGYMAGMIGYKESLKPFLTQWIKLLPR